ncbi:YlxR family protein [Actinomyces sp. MRS3W]|uniref:YlxR family protein n=1 Tax=Actinomyces sp. MRS3W TaxID=2800796 RepID=UPI0028FD13FA|nr:YlxR family protein [Actinomyces sp. MRS3W]MDU0348531.1 YlxR family protein [Actinomyces sp. MRS3W]
MVNTPHVPERTCIGCRSKAPRAQLLRLALTDSGELTVDVRALMPGRGAWIHPDLDCVALAERRRAFGRALRMSGPPDVAPVRDWVNLHGTARSRARTPSPVGDGTTDSKGG